MNNKNLCLLIIVSALMMASVQSKFQLVEAATNVKGPIGNFLLGWYHNQWFFVMRSMFDFYCYFVGITYLLLFNDGGANFYQCYYSVPYQINWFLD